MHSPTHCVRGFSASSQNMRSACAIWSKYCTLCSLSSHVSLPRCGGLALWIPDVKANGLLVPAATIRQSAALSGGPTMGGNGAPFEILGAEVRDQLELSIVTPA